MLKFQKSFLTILFLGAVFAGCSDDTQSVTGTYQGVVAFNNGDDGTISINVPSTTSRMNVRAQSSGATNITGECVFTGGTVPLEGTITPSNGIFSLSGGGYSFIGTVQNGSFTGNLTKDDSPAGSFSGVNSTTNSEVLVFCGKYSSGQTDLGVFLVVVGDNTITGSYAGSGGKGNLTGTRDGNDFSVQSTEGGSATGTISGNSVSGQVLDSEGTPNGVFTGSSEGCSV